jgi:glutathione S-transferase
MPRTDLVLHMFPASHFNEKARWALDWKGLPHARVAYLPGLHGRPIRRLSGQSQTPVLVMRGRAIPGSARILDELERAFPQRALYPEDPAGRERALAIQRRFDAEVGPATRTAVFSVLIHEPDHLCATFARRQPVRRRMLYRALLPLARPMIAKGNGVNPAGVEQALARVRQALDDTVRAVGPSGQLVGDRFSVADLAAAALLTPLLPLDHPDVAPPEPLPDRVSAFYARFEAHPAIQWVREQYAKHRPPPCDVPA